VAFTVKTGAGTVTQDRFKARHYTRAKGFARIFDEIRPVEPVLRRDALHSAPDAANSTWIS